jgi:hypothetical protein
MALVGHNIFLKKRNVIALALFFCSVSGLVPIGLGYKVIFFILALDLIEFPVFIPIVGKILARIFLVVLLFGLNAIGFGKLAIDTWMIIIFVIILTGGELLLSVFLPFLGDIAAAFIKGGIIFFITLFILRFDLVTTLILAGGLAMLETILAIFG